MNQFVDRAEIEISSGGGGSGAISFRREKHVPKGGPDGGDGGRGGSVVLEVDPNLWTLRDFQYQRRFRAGDGRKGMPKKMFGANGEDCLVKVPPGTLVYDAESGELVSDLVEPGQRAVAADGGRGGKGNARFATSTMQTPRVAEQGEPGRSRRLRLELKLLADVGLVGFPNAGKSTLLSRLTDARPRIAGYPFTTLSPNLGVMRTGDFRTYTVADMPGLIEGAHQGRGLGLNFLRHIERTRMLVFVVDASSRDPWGEYRVLRREMEHFNPALLKKPVMLAFNKMDLAAGKPPAQKGVAASRISALTGEGVEALRLKIIKSLGKHA